MVLKGGGSRKGGNWGTQGFLDFRKNGWEHKKPWEKKNRLFELVNFELLGTSENFTVTKIQLIHWQTGGGGKNVHEETLLVCPF